MTPPSPHLLIGLGNPGREYKDTRHNIGFMLVDHLAERIGARGLKVQSKAIVTSGLYEETKIILAKPQTYMNLSGQSVQGLLHFYKIPLENLIVAHDDLDIPFGAIRIRPTGGPGGQRGMANTIELLGTKDFPRLRLGIGRPPGRMDPKDYVLQNFSKDEAKILPEILSRAADAAIEFVMNGLNSAMNKFNGMMNGGW
ncbi:MAG: aminoacyl-tRNA hydrolase [Chloroflexi bacterium]|nr:aminoacyl-tRNA hydrolase [Chloroflexi bacterium CFX1]MCK6566781.1 aminoacyl-tRNA hydrolase [Anaerolineales bacterium]MDL1917704.1 aminoacyl-tRNA hydrolase [Chloroflexi bacterium CFX5]NUQ58081.1 aminoacyl-tRNA hydrolase [Anaerolineales bacterium]RIK55111.1 MAG: aminoacyl-tRNA hydrolase [Chloroflexota bacterium]